MPIITTEEIGRMVPALSSSAGQRITAAAMKFTALDRVNEVYDRLSDRTGADFAEAFLKDQGIDYLIGNFHRLISLPDGPFITVSNHPYGHIDGIMLIDMFGHLRPGYKVMVNTIISRIRALEPNFITVVPTGDRRTAPRPESISGVRETLLCLRNGLPVGFFPSGAVSDLSLRDGCIRDRQWQEPALRLIKKAGVPVIPVRFFDTSSSFYYSLGLISSKVRLLRLPAEALNKRGKEVRVGIGETIWPEMQSTCRDMEEFGRMLRSSVYDMPLPDVFQPRSGANFSQMSGSGSCKICK